MITISYENSVFRITDLSLFLEKLYYLNQEKNANESTSPGCVSKIVIDPNVFKFVILDLIKERAGIKTFCKECDLDYPDQIRIEKIGNSIDSRNIKKERGSIRRRIERLFEIEKPEKIRRFGGERLICPKGHELLTIVR